MQYERRVDRRWWSNNGMYGTIRMHQEREYPGRVFRHRTGESGFRRLCARLRPAATARRCERTAGFRASFQRARGFRQARRSSSCGSTGGDHALGDALGTARRGTGEEVNQVRETDDGPVADSACC